jgi:short subunit dehydrogenase-like uncharacterized protein
VRRVTVVLYGATGYTGVLTTDELVRRGAPFVLAGRNREKLERVSAERGAGAPVAVASLEDPDSLRRLLDEARVVINCAGPFTLAGEAVVRAAIDTGTHYVDSTGEQTYMRMVFERLGAEAERRGVALVPAMGFDYVPGDCIARLAAIGHEPLERLTIAYSVKGFGMSRGTMRSGLEMMKGGDVVYEDGDWRPARLGVFRANFGFPDPIGEQPMVRYPSGEVLTIPRHTRTREVRSLITARTVAPGPVAPALPFLRPGLALTLRTPLRRALGRAIEFLPEGPPDDERRSAEFTIVAEARGEDGRRCRGVVRGKDVYGLTAITLVHGAELMWAEGYDRAGALGPAAAYDPGRFLDYLTAHGLSWELERPAA